MFSLKNSRPDWFAVAIVVIAAVFRLLLLDIKPPHFDEGVNGWFVDEMTTHGAYHYDPTNYHGPLHFYVLFVSQTLFGRNLWALRVPLVLVSIATVWLILRFRTLLPHHGAHWAALAFAVSPGAVFFGRYAIHEAWLVFFLVLLLLGLTGLWLRGSRGWLWATILGISGAILTKETYTIHFAAGALAIAAFAITDQFLPSDRPPLARRTWTRTDLALATLTGVGLIVFFYSSTFLDFSRLRGLYETFAAWSRTGKGGSGHDKDWYYWLQLFGRYEWTCIAGILALAYAFLPKGDWWTRFVGIAAVGTLTAYSIISYKTPWCILSLLWPFCFLFGTLIAESLRNFPRRIVLTFAGALLAASAAMSIWLNFFAYTDEKEPYVYVQTGPQLSVLTEPLLEMARRDPQNYHLVGNLLVSSYHPIPWVLGDFTNIGYYDQSEPGTHDADFVLVEDDRLEAVEKKLTQSYFTRRMKLRPHLDEMTLFLNAETFRELYPGERPEFDPDLGRIEPVE
jgi:uncharacterized protein (TIGR03663 family)